MDDNGKKPWEEHSIWLRLLTMILFGIIFWLCQFILGVSALIQFGFVLITGHPSEPLRDFGGRLGTFLGDVTRYLTFVTDTRPFPFDDDPAQSPPGGPRDDTGTRSERSPIDESLDEGPS